MMHVQKNLNTKKLYLHTDLPLHTCRVFITEESLEIARNPQEILKTFLTSYLCELRLG